MREKLVPSVDDRLEALERQVAMWRRATVCTLSVLAVGGMMAFRQLAAPALAASSLTLRTAHSTVTLSLRASGDLEARFSRDDDNGPRPVGGSGLALVNPSGREVLRIGDVSARQLAP